MLCIRTVTKTTRQTKLCNGSISGDDGKYPYLQNLPHGKLLTFNNTSQHKATTCKSSYRTGIACTAVLCSVTQYSTITFHHTCFDVCFFLAHGYINRPVSFDSCVVIFFILKAKIIVQKNKLFYRSIELFPCYYKTLLVLLHSRSYFFSYASKNVSTIVLFNSPGFIGRFS